MHVFGEWHRLTKFINILTSLPCFHTLLCIVFLSAVWFCIGLIGRIYCCVQVALYQRFHLEEILNPNLNEEWIRSFLFAEIIGGTSEQWRC